MNKSPRCPTCRVRYTVGRHWNPNYDMLPLDKDEIEQELAEQIAVTKRPSAKRPKSPRRPDS